MANDSAGYLFAGTEAGVFRSGDNGTSWTKIFITGANAVAVDNSDKLYVSINGGGLFASTDRGSNWTNMNDGLPVGIPNSVFTFSINDSGHVFIATPGGIFRYRPTIGWEQVHDRYAATLGINTASDIFAMLRGTEQWGVYRSTDNRNTWLLKNEGFPNTNSSVQSFVFNQRSFIFAAFSSVGVFRSTDNGENWIKKSAGVTGSVLSLAVNSRDDVYAGSSSGIFITDNDGESWQSINTGLKNRFVYSLTVSAQERIFAGTALGVHQNSQITSVESFNPTPPTGFSLDQNYPNPFNPLTKIAFSVGEPGFVELVIYNSLGQRVRHLLREQKSAGHYIIVWDGRDDRGGLLSSGVYFYTLRLEKSTTMTKRLIFLK